MGHGQERSRGDSRIRDWPDAEWRLLRRNDDPASEHSISAFGRDIDQPEQRLAFEPGTRRLTIGGGSRREEPPAATLAAVLDVLQAADGGFLAGGSLKRSCEVPILVTAFERR